MHRVALLLDPNNLQHSEILELIQNKVVVKDARRLLHVGFDAADTPDVGALEHLHLMLTPGWSRKKNLLLLERTARRTWPLQTREMSTYWPVLRYSLSAENTVLRCSASKQLIPSTSSLSCAIITTRSFSFWKTELLQNLKEE